MLFSSVTWVNLSPARDMWEEDELFERDIPQLDVRSFDGGEGLEARSFEETELLEARSFDDNLELIHKLKDPNFRFQ